MKGILYEKSDGLFVGCTFLIDPTYGGMIVPPILPIILGHECGGIVEEIDSNVKHMKKGDQVAVEPEYPATSIVARSRQRNYFHPKLRSSFMGR